MLPGISISLVLTLNLILFFAVNLQNVIKGNEQRKGKTTHAEVKRPSGILFYLVALGTLVFFAEALLMTYLGIQSNTYRFISVLQLHLVLATPLQILGLTLVSSGILIFVWSVVARGRYSVAWEMPDDQQLVTWGPYRYVRHPSYLGYILMFSGIFFVWLNLIALVPMVGIPGYVKLVESEEELLISRFGDRYREYMGTTGRFVPIISKLTEVNGL